MGNCVVMHLLVRVAIYASPRLRPVYYTLTCIAAPELSRMRHIGASWEKRQQSGTTGEQCISKPPRTQLRTESSWAEALFFWRERRAAEF
jgi:hypothetical protein